MFSYLHTNAQVDLSVFFLVGKNLNNRNKEVFSPKLDSHRLQGYKDDDKCFQPFQPTT